jgi:iron complex outermembrane receptor protein
VGAGYRLTSGRTRSVATLQFDPADRTDGLASGFVQDEIALVPERLLFTVGTKIEHNDYSGFEAQPSARLRWTPSLPHTFVLSVTRAVRTPSRVERDLELSTVLTPVVPAFLRLMPNPAFDPERLVAYEAGYRVQPGPRLFMTISTFVNQHTDLLSTEISQPFAEAEPPPPHVVLPLRFANGLHGNSHGLEITSDLRVTGWWRWTSAYSFLRIQLTRDADSRDVSQERLGEGSSPRHQVELQSSMDLPSGIDVDWMFRYVSELPAQAVRGYATSDVRVAWLAHRRLELALVGKNLHQPHHLEFSGGTSGNVEVRRSAYASLTWHW